MREGRQNPRKGHKRAQANTNSLPAHGRVRQRAKKDTITQQITFINRKTPNFKEIN